MPSQTLESCNNRPGLRLYILKLLQRARGSTNTPSPQRYISIPIYNPDDEEGPLLSPQGGEGIADLKDSTLPEKPHQILPFRRIWTKNVL